MSSRVTAGPYDAPNSPIASAKRTHQHDAVPVRDRELNSPMRKHRRNDTYSDDDSCEELISQQLLNEYGDDGDVQSKEEAVDTDSDASSDEFDPYLFMYTLPPYSIVALGRKVLLPPGPRHHRTTLVLDLDETLVHCSITPVEKYDFTFPVSFNAVNYQVYVRKRPYVDYFLESVSNDFEIILFTASQSVYADKLLDLLDAEGRFFSGRLFREACLEVQGNFVKDLSILNRDLARTVLVDNSPYAYGYHIDNGIPIESWFDEDGDTELLKLIGFLRRLHSTADVRHVVRDHFKTYKLVENAGHASICDR